MGTQRLIGGWRLGDRLGQGGNAEVFVATRDGATAAIKILSDRRAARLARFCDEVEAMRRCADIPGVLPVIDFHVPATGERGPPWIAMGLANPIKEALGPNRTLRQVVEAMRDIARTLEQMHGRGISHRDIKPENLFAYDGRWAVGDFGLADFEGKGAETQEHERIGPLHYIAPEMLNNAAGSDGAPADVYSLTKTLWVLATGQTFPLPGAYDRTHDAFRIGSFVSEARTGQLDSLIAAATMFDPKARLPISQVVKELDAWLHPPASPAPPIRLDISTFAAELEKRSLAVESASERERKLETSRKEAGYRIRERLRPLAVDIETSLREAQFNPVSLNIERYHWGFEVYASIPDDTGLNTRLKINVGIDPHQLTAILATCRFELEGVGRSRASMLLWDSEVSFPEGGSQEDVELARLDGNIREELQHAVTTTLTIGIDNRDVAADTAQGYRVKVTDPWGTAVSDAEVLLIAADGTYLRNTTNPEGVAQFGPTAFRATTAFVAHREYPSEFIPGLSQSVQVAMKRADLTSSMIALRGWTTVKGLLGHVDFIHDRHGRKYIYTQNIAIDGGRQQPVGIELGKRVLLQESSGASVSIIVKAVQGPCFLVDLIKS